MLRSILLALLALPLTSVALAQVCGDGDYQPFAMTMPEQCDDGDLDDGDGCDSMCQIEDGWSCNNPPAFRIINTESYPGTSDDPNWVITGRSATETTNSDPSIGLFEADATAITYEFDVRVNTNSDDDFIGFVFGFFPGDTTNPAADYLLLDWKQGTQSGASAGMNLWRVQGIPDMTGATTNTDLWDHNGAVSAVASAATRGSTGWVDQATYRFAISYQPTRLIVTVTRIVAGIPVPGSMQEEFNVTPPAGETFPLGEIGFYAFSQENVTFTIIAPPPSDCDRDADGDSVFDVDDADADGDGVPDLLEMPDFTTDPDRDTDDDGVPDWNDPDHNPAGCPPTPTVPAQCLILPPGQDVDGDGVPNHLDLDSDGDGIPDIVETGNASLAGPDGRLADNTDSDLDGLADSVDEAPADNSVATVAFTPTDTDMMAGPDYLDTDSDDDGIPDSIEAFDTDGDGVIAGGEATPVGNDHDFDGIDDAYDSDCAGMPAGCMANGQFVDPALNAATDADGNGTPDWQQLCLDAYVTAPEACDDGNTDDSDACTSMCLRTDGEPCTLGPQCDSTTCNPLSMTCEGCADTSTGGIDEGCAAGAPACVTPAAGRAFCGACDDDQTGGAMDDGCVGAAPLCDPSSNTCASCLDDSATMDSGCSAGAPVCDTSVGLGVCVACEDTNAGTGPGDTDFGCGAGSPYCDDSGAAPVCVECLGAAQCEDGNDCTQDLCTAGACGNPDETAGTSCGTGDACDGAGTCVDCVDGGAGTDPGCSGGAPLCDVSGGGPGGMCVECLGNDDCGVDEFCTPTGVCAPGCDDDTDCDGGEVCHEDSMTCVACVDSMTGMGVDDGCAAGTPVCVGTGAGTAGTECVECTEDSHCDGAVCDLATNECMVCLDTAPDAGTDSGCMDATPVCDTSGADSVCVECLLDAHCPGLQVCDALSTCGFPDTDGDGVTDDVDLDDDGDGVIDSEETSGVDLSIDEDGDGVPGYADPDVVACADVDADGICDSLPTEVDQDGDGLPNHLDLDADGDGLPDAREAHDLDRDGVADVIASGMDVDMDGLDDAFDADQGGTTAPLPDADGDMQFDFLDVDSDDDGLSDRQETFDLDGDGVEDATPTGMDADGDGIDDAFDADAGGVVATALDTDSDGLADALDVDSDGDGLRDDRECPDPTRCSDVDMDGVADHRDLDSDGDGILDAIEGIDLNADGVADVTPSGTDADQDGLDDAYDPLDPLPDTDGDGTPDFRDTDDDDDGIASLFECPDPSACPDTDADGTPDYLDPDNGPVDTDGDGIPDLVECDGDTATCRDTDGDGMPDHMDPDDDDDGVPTAVECPGGPAVCDADGDGVPNHWDLDSDGDGILDAAECESGTECVDTDRDGSPDWLDLDSDGDGIVDAIEGHDADMDGVSDVIPLGVDSNSDGLDDAYDPDLLGTAAALQDTDSDGTPDWRDADDDGDGIATSLECPDPSSPCPETTAGLPNYLDPTVAPTDTDGDGLPDVFECPPPGTPTDRDSCPDSDGDGNPDFDDPDDDGDGIPTREENYDGDGDPTDEDSDRDGIPDYLDPDDDGDGIPTMTECPDFASGCPDTDGDGVPDYLDVCGDGTRTSFGGVTSWEECDDGNAIDGDGCDMSCRLETPRDGDLDMDGLLDSFECPPPGRPSDPASCPDSDGDGNPDFDDPDDDEDGVPTQDELGPGMTPRDTDMDGTSDHLDTDDDNDGVLTEVEVAGSADGIYPDTDMDGVPDHLDTDDDGDGLLTSDELGDGAEPRDFDGDGEPDWRDADDDNDGIPTATERRDGQALEVPNDDVDGDGSPNWLDVDADGDGILDMDERTDADGNGVPDYLEPNVPSTIGGYSGGSCSTGGNAGALPWLLGLGVFLLRRRRR